MLRNRWIVAAVGAALLCGCSSKPPAEVSKSGLASAREAHASIKVGDPKQTVLDSFKSGNKVKLGTSVIGGASIEEWKYEAFHDMNKKKDIFVTFLYFLNDTFVDSSDTRIDFRNNAELVERWKGGAAH